MHKVLKVKNIRYFFLSLLAVICWSGVSYANAAGTWATGRILVQPRAGLSDHEFDRIVKQKGGRALGRLRNLDVHIIEVPKQAEEAVARALAKNPHVKFAEKDMAVELSEVIPNDPQFGSAWHLPKIAAPTAWESTQGNGITVAILDTGVDGSHPDLVSELVDGWNVVSQNTDTADIQGHGTAVAGTVAAATNNSTGVSSIAWNARIMPVRITNRSDGWAYWSDIANGLTWAADHGADVANISYGVSNSSSITSAAQYMKQQGGIVVAAGGNDGTNPGYSDNPHIITVSATTSSDTKASWSNYGIFIDVAAPGVSILTTSRGGSYGNWSGTSFASPATAGVVALIMSANPSLSPDQVESILEQSADDPVTGSDWHEYYGYGRVNAAAAVDLALNADTTPVDTEAPTATIFSPTSNSTVSGLVPVEVSATDNVGVTEVALYADNQFIGVDSVAPYQFSWDSSQFPDGNVTLTAYAYDAAGNEANSNHVTVLVDNQPDVEDTILPTVNISNPADGSTVSRTVRISVNAADNVQVTNLKLYIDGILKSSVASGYLSYDWNTRKVSGGTHTISAVAMDNAGNNATTSIQVNVGLNGGARGKGKKK